MYYVYMIRCQDNSIYTGITNHLERRMQEHFEKEKKCAKYTMTHTAIKLEAVWKTQTRVQASKLEYYLKKLPKIKKEALIKQQIELEDVLQEKIQCQEYQRFIV